MKTKSSKGLSVTVCLLLATFAVAFWYKQQQRLEDQEHAAKKVLDELGAITVLDGAQRHVASLNLSTIKSRADLEKALAVVANLAWLESLDASRTAIANDDLIIVGELSRLNSLALGTTAIDDAGVSHLSNLSHLKSLNLAETGVTSTALVSIARLKSLMILDLSGTQVKAEFQPLAQLPRLEWLVLRNLDLNENALSALSSCPALHRLSLEESSYGETSLSDLLSSVDSLVVDK